ncbi:MAG TPA: VOC family protein [Bacillota bacterium]
MHGVGEPSIRFDHVIWVVPDLDAAARHLGGELGLHVTEVGEHPGRGTRNRCIHFDLAYLELIHVWNEELAAKTGTPFTAGVLDRHRRGGGLFTVALRVPDIERAATALGSAGFDVRLEEGSRRRADGSVVRWRTLDVAPPPAGAAPFFIQWEMDERQRRAHLSDAGFLSEHRYGPAVLDSVDFVTDRPERLADYYRRLLSSAAPGGFQERHGRDDRLAADFVAFDLPLGGIRILIPRGEPAGSPARREETGTAAPGLNNLPGGVKPFGEGPFMIRLRYGNGEGDPKIFHFPDLGAAWVAVSNALGTSG